jgi:glycosyltransferase involved in cell wall biosynthesis
MLISFKYPPYASVGSFRWSKLSKYLARMGYQIHVITVEWKYQHGKELLEEVKSPNIIIHRIKSGYCHNITYKKFNNYYLNGIKERALKAFNSVFSIFDEAQNWGHYLLPYCEKLIKDENIRVVIATGGPFQVNKWATVLKKKLPNIKLIQDFRDPWADHPFLKLSAERRSLVNVQQKEAVESANEVVCITNGLLDLYLKDSPHKTGHVIYNGCDSELKEYNPNMRHPPEEFSFAHIGSLTSGRDRPFHSLMDGVRKVKNRIPTIKVVLVGSVSEKLLSPYKDLMEQKILISHGRMSQADAHKIVRCCRYALQLNAKEWPYLVSTKIYEYGMLRVPTVSINYGGDVDELVKNNRLGYSVNLDKDYVEEFLINLYERGYEEFDYNIKQYEYKNLAAQYAKLIEGRAI